MRIAIDARFINPRNRGLACYTKNLIENLSKIDQKNDYFILLRQEDYKKIKFRNKNFHKIKAEVNWYGLKEQFMIPLILKKINPDLTHFPHFNVPIFWNGPFVSTIHDLILFTFPTKKATTRNKLTYFLKEKGYFLVIKKALFGSKKIISVSKSTKKDILRFFPKISEKKIKIIYEGLGETNEKILKEVNLLSGEERKNYLKNKFNLHPDSEFILYLGGAYPHKNLENLALAFRDASYHFNRKIYLILAGGDDFFFKKIKKFIKKEKIKNIIMPGFIEKGRELEIIYKEALFCIFPSLYEGFGLPPLEALRREKLVLCAKATSFPEILEDKALYFDGRNVSDISQKIVFAVKNKKNLKKETGKNLKSFLAKYDWEKTARKTLKIYEDLCEKNEK